MVKRRSYKTAALSLIFAITSFINICSAQNETGESVVTKNELSANVAYVIGGYTSISYERNLNTNLGVGLDLGTSIFSFGEDVDYSLAPFIRRYFPAKKKNLFFVEILGAYVSYSYERVFYIGDRRFSEGFVPAEAIGFGTSVGWKFINKKSFTVSIVLGVISNYGDTNFFFDDVVPRFGIYLGKRF